MTEAHRRRRSIVGRIPFATIILTLFMVSFYYSQDASHLCLFSSCPPEKHLYWTAQLPYPYNQVLGLLLEAFVHLSDYHLYTNLVNLFALAIPLESWILTHKPLTRCSVFTVAYSISVIVATFRLFVPINNAISVGYGASLMIIALAPFDLYYLHTEWPTLEGIGRFAPVGIGVGIGLLLILETENDLATTGSVLGENHLYAFFLACLVVVLVSIRNRRMKSRPARQDK